MRRPTRRRVQRVVDVLVPLITAVFVALVVSDIKGLTGPALAIAQVAALVAGGALWWRRVHPVRVLLVTLAATLVIALLAPVVVFPYAALIALFSVAAARPPSISVPSLAGVMGVTAVGYFGTAATDVTFAMVVSVVPWALGEAIRNRRAAVAEGARRAVSEEQERIGRELHDVLAHNLTVIVVQAAAADDVFDEQPELARRALRSIEGAGRGALSELRTVLANVRPEPTAPLGERLSALAEPLRAAGLTVDMRFEGRDSPTLPVAVDLSAYRIVQEALTNTLRHAGATRAEVCVRANTDEVEIDVVDDGVGTTAAAGGAGRGINGMRERARTVGGSLEAGPVPTGGFRVSARLPTGTRA